MPKIRDFEFQYLNLDFCIKICAYFMFNTTKTKLINLNILPIYVFLIDRRDKKGYEINMSNLIYLYMV